MNGEETIFSHVSDPIHQLRLFESSAPKLPFDRGRKPTLDCGYSNYPLILPIAVNGSFPYRLVDEHPLQDILIIGRSPIREESLIKKYCLFLPSPKPPIAVTRIIRCPLVKRWGLVEG